MSNLTEIVDFLTDQPVVLSASARKEDDGTVVVFIPTEYGLTVRMLIDVDTTPGQFRRMFARQMQMLCEHVRMCGLVLH